ncbi:response regulator [Epidermidibacterium keratini]|uniref:Response regulator n=1 Tax=Epidermidibacterium keratini TaxID=1891644 RepID=A0A7L4YLH2_9ACTN|nr:response regulator [Epidermidibacterium keratini]QHB99683.1 response regulator [Epidermidibacterium keratini]
MRVLVAEDQLLLRQGLVQVLEAGGCDVVAQVERGDEIVAAVSEHRPDLALLDIRIRLSAFDGGVAVSSPPGGPTHVAIDVPLPNPGGLAPSPAKRARPPASR